MLMRRKKKQLFRRKLKERSKRSLLAPFMGLMLGHGLMSERRVQDSSKVAESVKKVKVNTLLEIAGEKVQNVPKEFFQVVTSSNVEPSKFSENIKEKQLSKHEEASVSNKKKSRRNYKWKKSLFFHDSSIPWMGKVILKDNSKSSCPAILLTDTHVLVMGRCTDSLMAVNINGYTSLVTKVILHPSLPINILKIFPVPVEPLCHPEQVLPHLLRGVTYTSDLQLWIEQAIQE